MSEVNQFGDPFDMLKSIIALAPEWNVKFGVGIMVETLRIAVANDVDLGYDEILEALYEGITEVQHTPGFLQEEASDEFREWADEFLRKLNIDEEEN